MFYILTQMFKNRDDVQNCCVKLQCDVSIGKCTKDTNTPLRVLIKSSEKVRSVFCIFFYSQTGIV